MRKGHALTAYHFWEKKSVQVADLRPRIKDMTLHLSLRIYDPQYFKYFKEKTFIAFEHARKAFGTLPTRRIARKFSKKFRKGKKEEETRKKLIGNGVRIRFLLVFLFEHSPAINFSRVYNKFYFHFYG